MTEFSSTKNVFSEMYDNHHESTRTKTQSRCNSLRFPVMSPHVGASTLLLSSEASVIIVHTYHKPKDNPDQMKSTRL
jgi:hypothetical protein